MKPSSDKKHGLCDFEFIPIHLTILYLSMILCLLHLALGIMLIIFGNYINSGVFALWAITNKPWPAIELEDISNTENDVVFLQVVCWVCGALNFVPVFFMAWLAISYSSLILSPEPWTWFTVRLDCVMRLMKKTNNEMSKSQEQGMQYGCPLQFT